MIPQYQAFRADLQGYLEVPLRVFRDDLRPLRERRVWTESQRRLVATLHARGAGFALQRLLGAGHSEARAILGPAPAPFPMPRPALEARLQALLRSLRAASWRPETYSRYVEHLDGGGEFEEDGKAVPDA
ncbi:MAG TPA: hypothetical protein VNI01_07855, partial [Elusimicrobiota bacterium]|nr:hypothetical protein [Elusimicrobiota bacterium]